MRSKHAVRYYLVLTALLLFFYFSNNFGLIDIQKSALILAVGIDREDTEFIVTTQIAVPQSSEQGKEAGAVQLESRGGTVADALNQINVKTGWYPKLVFCKLIVLGEETVKHNVFDALDFFLRDEYMSDSCLVAACEGTAKAILDTATPIDPISSVAAGKVLSAHAEKVGTVAPSTLREFSIGYFSAARSGSLPVLKPEKLQESSDGSAQNGAGGESQAPQSGENKNGESQSGGKDKSAFSPSRSDEPRAAEALPAAVSGSEKSGSAQPQAEEKVFSAGETMLFYDGVAVGKLTPEETFAYCIVVNKLRLAAYTTESDGVPYTLNIKNNTSSVRFAVDKNAAATLDIRVNAVAGIENVSFAQTVPELSDTNPVPEEVFADAENSLKEQILSVFEKSRLSGCDLFGVTERLRKFNTRYYPAYREDILDRLRLTVSVSFEGIR